MLYESKTIDADEYLMKDKEMFNFIDYAAKSKYYDDSNNLVVVKMEDETIVVAIEGFHGLKPKMCSYF